MTRMWTAKHTAHTSTSRSPGAREKSPLMHSRYRATTDSTTAIHGGHADLALEEQTEHGDQHHIQRRDEARLAGVGAGHQTRLLEVGGDGQRGAAAQAAQPQLLVGGLLFLAR